MDESPQEIADRIAGMSSTVEVGALAERRLDAGDERFVADLGIALWQRYGEQPAPPWQYRSAFDRMLRLLTLRARTPGEALRLLSVAVHGRGVWYAASLLASGPAAADLPAVPAGELSACLLHELALRGVAVGDGWAVPRDHPLGWLPRSLTPLEGRPGLPRYTLNGSSRGGASIAGRPVTGEGPVPGARETTTEADAAAIGAAVANWAAESNGRIEARTFALDADLHPGALAATLPSLGLDSVRTLTQPPGACTPTDAWQQLFSAASAGGAYNSGRFGAYGRLLAWQSVAALAGAPADASPAGVEALAGACSWFSFAENTDWFDCVAWDVGLAVVSPDRRRLAVLAATDTD